MNIDDDDDNRSTCESVSVVKDYVLWLVLQMRVCCGLHKSKDWRVGFQGIFDVGCGQGTHQHGIFVLHGHNVRIVEIQLCSHGVRSIGDNRG